MIRNVSILLTVLVLTASFAAAQQTTVQPTQAVCQCAQGTPCCTCAQGVPCCNCAEAAKEAAERVSRDAAPAASETKEEAQPTRASRSSVQAASDTKEEAPPPAASQTSTSGSMSGTTEATLPTRASRTDTAPAAETKEEPLPTRASRTDVAPAAEKKEEPLPTRASRTDTEETLPTRASRTDAEAPLPSRVSKTEAAKEDSKTDEYLNSRIPDNIRYNEYYIKSVELSQQAQEAYDNGFYDGSIALAEEAIYYAELSDKYVAEQLIAEAKRLMDWADANSIETRYPNLYHASKEYYEISLEAQENSELTEASIAAINAIEILGPLEAGKPSHLPSQYTVRTWRHDRDCLWNIAGYPFVYGDPHKWRILYDANKSRMRNPNNPNIIEPGFVLEIPNLPGENRSGMWEPQDR